MDRDSLLPDLQVRFTEPADVEAFGPDWFTYSELAIATLPAREVIRLEAEIGVPMPAVMQGQREDATYGNLAAAWLAVRASGKAIAWKAFNPVIMLCEWRTKPADEGKAEGEPTPAATSAVADLTSSAPDTAPEIGDESGSAGADIVVLPIMPRVE